MRTLYLCCEQVLALLVQNQHLWRRKKLGSPHLGSQMSVSSQQRQQWKLVHTRKKTHYTFKNCIFLFIFHTNDYINEKIQYKTGNLFSDPLVNLKRLFVWFLPWQKQLLNFKADVHSANLSLVSILSQNWHSGAQNKNCVKKGHCVQLLP